MESLIIIGLVVLWLWNSHEHRVLEEKLVEIQLTLEDLLPPPEESEYDPVI